MRAVAQVLTGAAVHSMVPGAAPAEAVAVQAGCILALGCEAEVLRRAGPAATVERVSGAVLPGLIDAHHHLSLAVVHQGTVDCHGAGTAAEVCQRLARAAARTPTGAWILGHGLDERQLAGHRPPSRRQLDQACPDHPALLIYYSFHQAVANSLALERAAIGRTTADPQGGEIARGRRGEPSGMLYETAMSLPESLAHSDLLGRDRAGFLARLASYEQQLLVAGITRLADPTVSPREEALYQQARQGGHLRLPVLMMPVGQQGFLVPPWDRLDGPVTGHGPEQLQLGPLKLFMDGGDRCAVRLRPGQALAASIDVLLSAGRDRTLAPLRALQRGRARLTLGGLRSGTLFHPRDHTAAQLIRQATDRGFAVGMHCLGNEAVEQAARLLRDAPPSPHPAFVHRVEHAMLASRRALRRIADAGACVVAQPAFVELLAAGEVPRIPGLGLVALRTMLDLGLTVAGSSDAPVIPFEPLLSVHAAVTRRPASQRLTVHEALQLYTRHAAAACGCLEHTGTLEPGKRADLVLLDRDPLASPWTAPPLVTRTLLAGEVVHQAGEGA